MLSQLISSFNQKASTIEFIENIEIMSEEDEIYLYWLLDPGERGGSMIN